MRNLKIILSNNAESIRDMLITQKCSIIVCDQVYKQISRSINVVSIPMVNIRGRINDEQC